jgi:hypothetical protein
VVILTRLKDNSYIVKNHISMQYIHL